MGETSQLLMTFILNALWQISAITAVALVCTKLLYRMPSRYSHAVWALALTACLLVPATTILLHGGETVDQAARTDAGHSDRLAEPGSEAIPVSLHSLIRPVSISPSILYALLWTFAALLLFRAIRIVWLGYQTWRVRYLAYVRPLPPSSAEIVERCVRSFSLSGISILCSAEASGPCTLGIRRPVLLLPERFFITGLVEDDIFSAVSHELAHVRRHDFFFNLLYEVAYIPLCFHPCAAFILSRIAQTRELACDEIAARMLPTAGQYARSLLHIAQSMFAEARSDLNYALGIFDTNTLEERIMNILKTNHAGGKRARVLRLAAVCLIGVVSLGLSAFSLRLTSTSNSADLEQFAGTWEAKYQGTTFFTLHLKLANGSLGGTCIHTDRLEWVDGDLIPTGNELTTDKILKASGSGKKLVLKIGDGNSSDGFALEFTLTAPDRAEAKVPVPSDSGSPPQKKPWHFLRIAQ